MSRYLRTVERETRSTLRRPPGRRLAPQAPAIFDEAHEERVVNPAPTVPEISRLVQPQAAEPRLLARRSFDDIAISFAPPSPPSRREEPQVAPAEERPAAEPATPEPAPVARLGTREQPAAPVVQPHAPTPRQQGPAPATPAVARSEPRPIAPAPQRHPESLEIVETAVRSASYLVEDERPATKEVKEAKEVSAKRAVEFAIPETVRHWLLRPETEPSSAAVQQSQPPIPAAPQPLRSAPHPVIDVTIGRVEVTIESEPQPPLRITPQPVSAPRKSTPPPMAGRLARQYMDR